MQLSERTKRIVTRMGIEFIFLAKEDMVPLGLLTSSVRGMDGRKQNLTADVCIIHKYCSGNICNLLEVKLVLVRSD